MESRYKLNAGFITHNIDACRAFYTEFLSLRILVDLPGFYLLLGDQNNNEIISFLMPDHPTQHDIFRKEFAGYGAYITIEVKDVKAEFERLKKAGAPIISEIKHEPWGDIHFILRDPNGIGIDIVQRADQ
jgi:catechol 2,3-dioxygenase-like lactoylglutathione lyase family enzyme